MPGCIGLCQQDSVQGDAPPRPAWPDRRRFVRPHLAAGSLSGPSIGSSTSRLPFHQLGPGPFPGPSCVMIPLLSNSPATPTQLPVASNPAAGSGSPSPAHEIATPRGALQPRAEGSDAATAMAPRQSLQGLRPAGPVVAGVPAGAASPDHHVIDIDRPGSQPASAAAGPASATSHRRDCGPVLLTNGLVAAGGAVLNLLESHGRPGHQEQTGLDTPTIALAAVGVAALSTWLATRGRASPGATPADVPGGSAVQQERTEPSR